MPYWKIQKNTLAYQSLKNMKACITFDGLEANKQIKKYQPNSQDIFFHFYELMVILISYQIM